MDDEALLRWSLAETFSSAGYEVLEAASTRSALLALTDADHPIDAALLDLKLPDGDGLDLLQQARRKGVTCPVLIMTAYGSAEALQRAQNLAATGVISKPFDLDHVLVEVKRICPLPL